MMRWDSLWRQLYNFCCTIDAVLVSLDSFWMICDCRCLIHDVSVCASMSALCVPFVHWRKRIIMCNMYKMCDAPYDFSTQRIHCARWWGDFVLLLLISVCIFYTLLFDVSSGGGGNGDADDGSIKQHGTKALGTEQQQEPPSSAIWILFLFLVWMNEWILWYL